MGFKSKNKYFGFADLELMDAESKNRSLDTLRKLTHAINWEKISVILMKNYCVGKSRQGNAAYPPLMLFKCLLLQKWFRIKSDPELESQINDRISFKDFLSLPLGVPSPDHSTFSRFRDRISKTTFDKIHSEILGQFVKLGLSINEGIAIDARLVKSASKPLKTSRLKELEEERSNPEGQLDKNGNPRKFSRDLELNWIVKNDKPHYGLKEHASVDVKNGFVLATTLIPASVHDTNLFQYCTIFSRHTSQILKNVYADKGYQSKLNRSFLSLNGFGDKIMRKDTRRAKLTPVEIERNKDISKLRYIVEQYFGLSDIHDGAARARFTTIAKNNIDLWFKQAALNIKRGFKILNQKQTAV
ncbi:IS5 family transposase [Desulfocicer niacini]